MKGFIAIVLLVLPQVAMAQVQPHRAEYSLRLGAAVNAPRIGKATQDITSGCPSWRVDRDIAVQIPLTSSWKVGGASKLEGEEQGDGSSFRYHSVETQDDVQHETHGVARRADEMKVGIDTKEGHKDLLFPPATLLPVGALNHLIDRLRAGTPTTSMLIFAGEASDVYRVEVKGLKAGSLRPAPRVGKPVQVTGRSWTVAMTFRKPGQSASKPVFSINGRIFETGVLDRLTIDAGIFTVAADLQTLSMHGKTACPEH